MSKLFFVIDGNSTIYSSFFGMPPLTNAEGTQVQAAYAVSQLLLRLREELRPDRWAFVLDSKAPSFRHESYPEYKAHRSPMPDELRAQLPIIDEILKGFSIPVIRKDGVEADDVVATLAHEAEAQGYEVRVVSRDKDLEQVLSDKVKVWDPKNGSTFGPEQLQAKRGLTPQRVIEYLALVGDKSDNVPGVAGVGPKTALKALEAASDIEQLLVNDLDEKSVEIPATALKKIRTHADAFRLSRDLVRLRLDVPLDEGERFDHLEVKPWQEESLRTTWQGLGFQKFLAQLGSDISVADERAGAALEADERVPLNNLGQLQRLVAEIEHAQGVVLVPLPPVDALAPLTGLGLQPQSPRSLTGAAEPEEKRRQVYHLDLSGGAIRREDAWGLLKPLLEDNAIGKWCHDIKALIQHLLADGIDLQGAQEDSMLGAYLINSQRRSYSLQALSSELLHTELPPLEAQPDPGELLVTDPTPHALGEYCAATRRVVQHLGTQLDERELTRVYSELELPLGRVLAHMERQGISLEPTQLAELEAEVCKDVAQLEAQIHEDAGEAFNINSPKQLGVILFEKLGLPTRKKTKTGYSTDADTLEELAAELPDNPLPQRILEYRSLSKLLGTYIHALPPLVRPESGRIHTIYSQTAAATGRLSSSDPNLQNIPIRSTLGRRIRKAFVPNGQGNVFLAADYSQIELRLLAHLSQDPTLLQVLRDGHDIHQEVAARVFGVDGEEVTREQRSAAKAVNFGVIYGMGAFGLSKDIGISFGDAKKFIAAFFEQFPGVREFIDNTVESARAEGEVRTLFGRRRPIPDIHARIPNRRNRAEREAVNTVVQGSAADLIKKAMIDVHRQLNALQAPVEMLLQIHDELLFELPAAEVEEYSPRIQEWMEGVIEVDVPLTVNVSTGGDWFDASK